MHIHILLISLYIYILFNIDPFFSPIQIMNIQSGLYGVKKNMNRNLEILKDLDLLDKAKAYSRSLSGGNEKEVNGR